MKNSLKEGYKFMRQEVEKEAYKYLFFEGKQVDWRGFENFKANEIDIDFTRAVGGLVIKTLVENNVLCYDERGSFFLKDGKNPRHEDSIYCFSSIEEILRYRKETNQLDKKIAVIID